MLSTLKKYLAAILVLAIAALIVWLWFQEMLPFVNHPDPEIVGQVGYWDTGDTEGATTRFMVECSVRNTGKTSSISISAIIRANGPGFLRAFAEVSVPRNETGSYTFAFERADRLADRSDKPDYECLLGDRAAATVEPTQTPATPTPTS